MNFEIRSPELWTYDSARDGESRVRSRSTTSFQVLEIAIPYLMKKIPRIVLGVLISTLSLAMILNFPLVETSVAYNCSYYASNMSALSDCTAEPNYETILQAINPCVYGCEKGASVPSITLFPATLHFGNASTFHMRGSAYLSRTSESVIADEYIFTSSNGTSIELYSLQQSGVCSSIIRAIIPSEGNVGLFNATFYLSSVIEQGAQYNYEFAFANGQSVSGELTAE